MSCPTPPERFRNFGLCTDNEIPYSSTIHLYDGSDPIRSRIHIEAWTVLGYHHYEHTTARTVADGDRLGGWSWRGCPALCLMAVVRSAVGPVARRTLGIKWQVSGTSEEYCEQSLEVVARGYSYTDPPPVRLATKEKDRRPLSRNARLDTLYHLQFLEPHRNADSSLREVVPESASLWVGERHCPVED